jgi:hypothetical protein
MHVCIMYVCMYVGMHVCSTSEKRVYLDNSDWHTFHGNFLEIRAGAGGPSLLSLNLAAIIAIDAQYFFFFLPGRVQ